MRNLNILIKIKKKQTKMIFKRYFNLIWQKYKTGVYKKSDFLTFTVEKLTERLKTASLKDHVAAEILESLE